MASILSFSTLSFNPLSNSASTTLSTFCRSSTLLPLLDYWPPVFFFAITSPLLKRQLLYSFTFSSFLNRSDSSIFSSKDSFRTSASCSTKVVVLSSHLCCKSPLPPQAHPSQPPAWLDGSYAPSSPHSTLPTSSDSHPKSLPPYSSPPNVSPRDTYQPHRKRVPVYISFKQIPPMPLSILCQIHYSKPFSTGFGRGLDAARFATGGCSSGLQR